MLKDLKEYHRPREIETAYRVLATGQTRYRLLAGGTQLLASADPHVEGVVDLSRLDLRGVHATPGGLKIGAMTTIQQVVESPAIRAYASGIVGVGAYATSVSKMIRNMATIGGEICRFGRFSELVTALLVVDAHVRIYDSRYGTLPLEAFLNNRQDKDRGPFVLTEILLPEWGPDSGADVQRLSTLRSSPAILAVGASLRVEGERAVDVRIAMSGGYPRPQRFSAAERRVEGGVPGSEMFERLEQELPALLDPPTDLRATAEYRRQAAPVLIRRALQNCWSRAKGAGSCR